MTAAAADRKTKSRALGTIYEMALAAQLAYAGVLMARNSSGYLVMATGDDDERTVGISQEQVDNSAGSAGDLNMPVQVGEFYLANSASADEITIADIGNVCYVVDNQTVARTSSLGTRPAAGVVTGVDANGVWVLVGLDIDDDAFVIIADVTDLVSANTQHARSAPAHRDGRVEYITTTLYGGDAATGDATITTKIDGTNITGGVVTIDSAASQGDVDTATPTAANVFTAGQVLSGLVGGTNDGANSAARVAFVCKPA